jgi:multiple sugar transport system ATP-binding protein
VILGIRPEDISLGEIETGQTITGYIFLVEDFGKEKLLSLRVTGSDHTVRMMVPSDRSWEGENITVSLFKKQFHCFDVETGDRLNSST